MSQKADELFGKDRPSIAMLLHLALRLRELNDGEFKSGFQMAIEEAGAYLDSLHRDSGSQAQTLMEQVCGLMNGHYALTEIKGPIGVVKSS